MEGRIIERLVRYAPDGYDSEKVAQDEILGEVSDERYQELYQLAQIKLAGLKEIIP